MLVCKEEIKMDIKEIKNNLNQILTRDISLNMFFVLEDEEGNYFKRKVDLEQGKTTEELIDLFKSNLLINIIGNEELCLCNLSESDDRRNAIYYFDYDVYPKDLCCIHDFNLDEDVAVDKFSFSNENLSGLRGYLIYLGSMTDGVVLYKKHYPISLIKRDSFMLYKKQQRFVRFDGDEMLRLNENVQVMKLNNEIYALDIDNFERNFGFESLIIKRATETIEEIEQIGILEDVQVLKDLVDDITFARKLSKIREKSPVITLNISNDDIINFTKTNPGLRGRFKYSEDGKQIRLDTKASKNAFIKLLNDDYLRSNLTNQEYDSIAKDRINAERRH